MANGTSPGKQRAARHQVGALAATLASGLAAWLASRGLAIPETALLPIISGVAISAYAAVEQLGKRFTSEEPEVRQSELKEKHETILKNQDELGARLELLEDLKIEERLREFRLLLPQACDYAKGGQPCNYQKGHDGPHSFEPGAT